MRIPGTCCLEVVWEEERVQWAPRALCALRRPKVGASRFGKPAARCPTYVGLVAFPLCLLGRESEPSAVGPVPASGGCVCCSCHRKARLLSNGFSEQDCWAGPALSVSQT